MPMIAGGLKGTKEGWTGINRTNSSCVRLEQLQRSLSFC
jgi:hypothetical protein